MPRSQPSRPSLLASIWLVVGTMVALPRAMHFVACRSLREPPRQGMRLHAARQESQKRPSDSNNETATPFQSAATAALSAAFVASAAVGVAATTMQSSASAAQYAGAKTKLPQVEGPDVSSAIPVLGGVVVAAAIPAIMGGTGNYTRRPSDMGLKENLATIAKEKALAKAEAKKEKDAGPAKKEVKKETAPTGNSLYATLTFCCNVSDAEYAIYWIPAKGRYIAAGEYYVRKKRDQFQGTGKSYAQKLSAAETGGGSLLSQYASSDSTVLVEKAQACSDKGRAAVHKDYGVKSVQFMPFDSGLIEFGTSSSWSKAYDGAPVPLDGFREAYEGYNSTYSLFWTKGKSGMYEAASNFVTPARKKALKNRRGDDKTFASESKGLKLPEASMVGRVASSGKEAFLQDAMNDPKFTRAALAKEFAVKSIRVVPCAGGVLEYGIPKADQLSGNTMEAMLKMRCDIAGMDYASYWVEDSGKMVVAGTYTTPAAKKANPNDRFELASEKVKLDSAALNHGFIKDASASNSCGRQDLAKKYGIKTIIQEQVRGGVIEFGTTKCFNEKPPIPLLPEKELKTAFDDFGAVYVLLWVRRGDKWLPEASFTTPERIAFMSALRTDGKTYSGECSSLKLGENSVVGLTNQSKQTDVIYGADENKQFTRRALAKEFDLQTIRFVPCQEGVVLECGTSERKTTGKKASFKKDGEKGGTDRGRATNLARMKEEANKTPTGMLTPYVDAAKMLVGDDNLIEFRKDWIQNHTGYIADGVKGAKTSWAPQLFASFDVDKDGRLDKSEFAKYVETLGWGEVPDKQKIDKMLRNYDPSGDNSIELKEFAEAAPTFVRKSLIKLATKNGKVLGLLV